MTIFKQHNLLKIFTVFPIGLLGFEKIDMLIISQFYCQKIHEYTLKKYRSRTSQWKAKLKKKLLSSTFLFEITKWTSFQNEIAAMSENRRDAVCSVLQAASRKCTWRRLRAFWINSVTFLFVWPKKLYRNYKKISGGFHINLDQFSTPKPLYIPILYRFSRQMTSMRIFYSINLTGLTTWMKHLISAIKSRWLSVSLAAMGAKWIGGIQSSTVPDMKLFTK